ncbi:hypothetical protein [Alicyclobacillus sp.]|uniref:hypothetical protein n=1 Tax=Alicyclobacillus sp. TaxID=61169 RepID=UPI0025C03C88|nr:hypothetical protein [Alicyclobacillus sp.]MCL6516281.1 hypothetical protein [Alicyclobacillus sp.]
MKQRAHEAVLEDVVAPLERLNQPEARRAATAARVALNQLASLPKDRAEWHAKGSLRLVADAAQAATLYRVAETAGERYEKLATLYIRHFMDHEEYPDWALSDSDIWGVGLDAARIGS